jgi:hypothetical protein
MNEMNNNNKATIITNRFFAVKKPPVGLRYVPPPQDWCFDIYPNTGYNESKMMPATDRKPFLLRRITKKAPIFQSKKLEDTCL